MLESLLKKLNDTDRDVRDNAIIALGDLGDERARDPLYKFLLRAVGIEKFLPACSLAKLHDPRAKDYLLDYLAYAHTRERAFDSLKLLNVQSEELFQAYLRVLQNRDVADWFARQEAAKALVAMDDERAIRPLEALLADHNNTYRDKKDDLNHMDRITIIEALNKLRKKQSKSWKFW